MKFISLFSGIGGFDLGLKNIGMECVWSNDINKKSCKVYKKHFGDKELYEGNIRDVDCSNIPDCDLLCAGFPCQTFSVAGNRNGLSEDRGTLFKEIYRIAKTKKPSFLLMENVEGLLSNDNGKSFTTILRFLGQLGYILEWQVLNSKDFGVPQNRARVFIIGHLRKESFKPIFPLETGQNTTSIRLVTQITGDTPSGLSRQEERVYDLGGLSPTLTASFHIPLIMDNKKLRQLTPVECERLQGFPDNWTDCVKGVSRYTCIGNSVTVPVIECLGQKIMCL